MGFHHHQRLLVYFLAHCIILAYGSKLYFESSQVLNYDLIAGSSKSCMDVLDEDAEKKILSFPFPLKNDRNMDLQLVFLGENSETQVLLTTMTESFVSFFMTHHQSSHLYQSTDGGRTFQKIEQKIGSSSIRSTHGIMKSPLDHSWVILVSYTSPPASSFFDLFPQLNQKSILLISKDAGKNFTSFKMPFKLRENEPLLFHPKKKNWIIGLEERKTVKMYMGKVKQYGQAWISKDFGKTWKEMMKGHVASSAKWGAAKGKEGDEIYLATHIKTSSFRSFLSMFMSSSSTLTLWKSSDGGTFFEEIIEHCYNFGVEGDFVFASVVFNVSSGKSGHRVMHISKDSGANFRPINVPEITSDRFYAVLEMHKGMIFLHVDENLDTGKGTLFISGSDGVMYTKSLDDHFYTNHGVTDFTRVESMHGVYITQVLQKDNTLKSVISFDRGVSWQPLYVDKNKYCKNNDEPCMIHFHKDYSRMKRRIDVQGPLSSASAPGIIFIHGQSGDALTGTVQVWLSINGGYNWTKIADSPHHYAIGDNGNLLVIVPRINNTGNILKYSIDQGRCWHDYKFSDDNQEMVIRGLVTEPHAKDRTFSLWGYFKNVIVSQKEWNVITVSFHGMFSRKCDVGDFDEWTPHIPNGKNGCFLGEKIYYKKPKLTVSCYLGKNFKSFLKSEKCKCDKDDLECDYGYERQDNGKCKENKLIKPIELCKKGEEVKERFSIGYRRVPGDECESKEAVDDVVKFVDEHIKCTPSKEDAYGVIKEEKLIVESEKNKEETNTENDESGGSYQTKIRPLKSKGHGFFMLIAILVVIGALIGIGWYGVKFIRKTRGFKPSYVISELTEDIGEDKDVVYDPRPKTQRKYKDESDADDDVLLPV